MSVEMGSKCLHSGYHLFKPDSTCWFIPLQAKMTSKFFIIELYTPHVGQVWLNFFHDIGTNAGAGEVKVLDARELRKVRRQRFDTVVINIVMADVKILDGLENAQVGPQ